MTLPQILAALRAKAVYLRDGSVGNQGRRFYVPMEEIERILKEKK